MSDDLVKQTLHSLEGLDAYVRALDEYNDALVAANEELEAKLAKAANRLEKLSRWLDLDDEELAAVPIEQLPLDHRHVQYQVNATLKELKDQT